MGYIADVTLWLCEAFRKVDAIPADTSEATLEAKMAEVVAAVGPDFEKKFGPYIVRPISRR
jgi:hypothetical protein